MKRSVRNHNLLKNSGLITAVVLIIGFLIFALNHYMPLMFDDYSYSFSFASGERITEINQIIPSQIGHYSRINGRSVTHTLAQCFLLLDATVFDIINSAAFIALLFLIWFHAHGSLKQISPFWFTVEACLLFLCTPAFDGSFLWTTGSANYLYGILIILCVMVPYRLQADGRSIAKSLCAEIILAMLYLILGILAGWTNENTSVAMIAMMAAYMVLYHSRSIKIHAWNITGCIGGIIGCAFMLLAPGTANRLANAGGSGGILMWLKRVIIYSSYLIDYLHLAILAFLVLTALYWYQKGLLAAQWSRQKIGSILDECGVALLYLLGFFGSVYSMIISPSFPERVWSGPLALALIVILRLGAMVDTAALQAKIGKGIALFFLLIVFVGSYFQTIVELRHFYNDFHEREAYIAAAVANGERKITLPSLRNDLNADSSQWPNTAIARYYEVDEIIRAEEQEDS